MYDKNELCEKIKTLYPDIGECNIDLNVDYDEEHFPDNDVDSCMEGKQCISLGLEVAQFKD